MDNVNVNDAGFHFGVLQCNKLPYDMQDMWQDTSPPQCPKCGSTREPIDHGGCELQCATCLNTALDYLWHPDEPTRQEIIIKEGGEVVCVIVTRSMETAVIVHSKWYTLAKGCSPCYPNAGDLESPHYDGIPTLCLPPEYAGRRYATYWTANPEEHLNTYQKVLCLVSMHDVEQMDINGEKVWAGVHPGEQEEGVTYIVTVHESIGNLGAHVPSIPGLVEVGRVVREETQCPCNEDGTSLPGCTLCETTNGDGPSYIYCPLVVVHWRVELGPWAAHLVAEELACAEGAAWVGTRDIGDVLPEILTKPLPHNGIEFKQEWLYWFWQTLTNNEQAALSKAGADEDYFAGATTEPPNVDSASLERFVTQYKARRKYNG